MRKEKLLVRMAHSAVGLVKFRPARTSKGQIAPGFGENPILRFMGKVSITDGCWLWTGMSNRDGYGLFRWSRERGQSQLAHRTMWKNIMNKAIPHKYTIDHLCMNRACVRPSHLEAVTIGENNRRARAKRKERAEANGLELRK